MNLDLTQFLSVEEVDLLKEGLELLRQKLKAENAQAVAEGKSVLVSALKHKEGVAASLISDLT